MARASRAEQRPGDRGDAAHDGEQHDREAGQRALQQRELLGADLPPPTGEQCTAESGDGGGEGEDLELRASQVEAEGGAGRWAVLHRLEPPAELAAAKGDDPDAEQAEHERHEDQVGPVAVERKPSNVEPARPPRHRP